MSCELKCKNKKALIPDADETYCENCCRSDTWKQDWFVKSDNQSATTTVLEALEDYLGERLYGDLVTIKEIRDVINKAMAEQRESTGAAASV